MKYPESERILIIRPCLKTICLGIRPAAKLLSLLLFYTRNCDEQETTYTFTCTQEDLINDLIEEMDVKTLHRTAVPMLKFLGYLDVDGSSYRYRYTVHLDLIQQALSLYKDKKQLDKFLIVSMQAQLDKIPIEQLDKNLIQLRKQLDKSPIQLEKCLIELDKILIVFRHMSNSKRGRKPKPQAVSDTDFEETQNNLDISLDDKRDSITSADATVTPSQSENDNHSYSLQSTGYMNHSPQKGHAHESFTPGPADYPPSALPGTRRLAAIPELERRTPPPAQIATPARAEKGHADVPALNDYPDSGAAVHERQVASDLPVLDRSVHSEADTVEPDTEKPLMPPGMLRLPSKTPLQQTPAPVLSPPSHVGSPTDVTVPSQATLLPPIAKGAPSAAVEPPVTASPSSAPGGSGGSKGKHTQEKKGGTQAKDEPVISLETMTLFHDWCSLFKVEVPLNKANSTAAGQLVKPIAAWAKLLGKTQAEVLRDIKDWLYKNDKNHYYNGRGVKLYDVSREFEGWQSEQQSNLEREERRRKQEEQAGANSNGTPLRPTVSGRRRLDDDPPISTSYRPRPIPHT